MLNKLLLTIASSLITSKNKYILDGIKAPTSTLASSLITTKIKA